MGVSDFVSCFVTLNAKYEWDKGKEERGYGMKA